MPKIMSGNHCTEWSWPFTQSWTLCGSTFRCTLTHSKICRRKRPHSIQWAPHKCTWRWNLDVCPNFKSLEKVKQNKEVSTLIKYTTHCFEGRWKSQVPLWWWKKKTGNMKPWNKSRTRLDNHLSLHMCVKVWRVHLNIKCLHHPPPYCSRQGLSLTVEDRISHWSQSLPVLVDWLFSKPHGSTHLCPSQPRITRQAITLSFCLT